MIIDSKRRYKPGYKTVILVKTLGPNSRDLTLLTKMTKMTKIHDISDELLTFLMNN